jgi:hypothetical protein
MRPKPPPTRSRSSPGAPDQDRPTQQKERT